MPSIPIYIRKEDWEKWEAIQDKPEFIHNALNDSDILRDPIKHKAFDEVTKSIKTPKLNLSAHPRIPTELNVPITVEDIEKVFPEAVRQPIAKSFSARKKKGLYK